MAFEELWCKYSEDNLKNDNIFRHVWKMPFTLLFGLFTDRVHFISTRLPYTLIRELLVKYAIS